MSAKHFSVQNAMKSFKRLRDGLLYQERESANLRPG